MWQSGERRQRSPRRLPPSSLLAGAEARTEEEEGGEQSTRKGLHIFPQSKSMEWNALSYAFVIRTQWEGREMMEVASCEGACKYVYGDRLKGGP